ncbi:MAG: formylglycine-generating enzyme family protein [Bradymonadia bacterium]|jgi:formylglycine-generating enzyme required for sulfatase activity
MCDKAVCTPACVHGTCSESHQCVCEAGWKGEQCDLPICNVECTGNRVCTAPEVCGCRAGWEGSNCDISVCEVECKNGGICLTPNVCTCAEGWEGATCEIPVCDPTCGENQECIAPNVCKCKDGWIGNDCKKPVCAFVCRNGGACTSPNVCTCSPFYTGQTCEEPVCKPDCGENQSCIAPNECQCNMGWTGSDCKTAICDKACNNGGKCTAPNVCSCAAGWSGETCLTPVCDPECGAHKTCTAPNTCTCDHLWTGDDCQTAICEFVCQNGGTCTEPNVCSCTAGWFGNTCVRPLCDPRCENGQRCVAVNECSACPPNWLGDDCKTPERIRIPATGDSTRFMMGAPEDGVTHFIDSEIPVHEVTLSAYKIDRYLVTVASYKRCVDAGACEVPATSEHCTYGELAKERYPINCVGWEQAKTYCTWAGGRLPTEAEWERAAKGEKQIRYPWGNGCPRLWLSGCEENWEYNTAKANCYWDDCYESYDATSPVDQFPLGMSPDGLYDMAGNVWEWVNDFYGDYSADPVTNPTGPEHSNLGHVIRGGSWGDWGYRLRTTSRSYESSFERGKTTIGFRCAADIVP